MNEEKRKANIIKAQNKEFFAFVMKTWVAEMKTESQISFEFLSQSARSYPVSSSRNSVNDSEIFTPVLE